MNLRVKRLDPRAQVPKRSHDDDAGFDLYVLGDHAIPPHTSKDIPSGIAVEPVGLFWCRIVGRSSTHRRRGLTVREGIIDTGYRGELLTYVTNDTDVPVEVKHGERLAQVIPTLLIRPDIVEVGVLSESSRGTGGFGSTGGGPFDEQVTASRLVYLGGPIDAADRQGVAERAAAINISLAGRRTALGAFAPHYSVYDPAAARVPGESYEATVQRNMHALEKADHAVFVWSSGESFGTPVEIWQKAVVLGQPERVLLVGDGGQGMMRSLVIAKGARTVTIDRAAEIILG